MPPKRKRADETTEPASSSSTRATRSSTRSTAGTKNAAETMPAKTAAAKKTSPKTATKAAARKKEADAGAADFGDSNELESAPPAKKSRTKAIAASSTTAKKQTVRKSAKGKASDDILEKDQQKAISDKNLPLTVSDTKVPPTQNISTSPTTLKSEPYSAQRAQSLFIKYAESDDPTVIGPEGFEKLCSDANMPLEGSLPLILAWQLEAKEMAKISNQEWTKTTSSLKISSLPLLTLAMTELEHLLVRGQSPIKKVKKEQEPYNRAEYWGYTDAVKATFQKLYMFCFTLAKPEQSRNIDMDTAAAFWSVLLVPQYPLMGEVLEFITEKGSYRAANKDLWTMMLEFCQTVNPNLQDYEADGAWPTLLDDFVAWKKGKMSNGHNGDTAGN